MAAAVVAQTQPQRLALTGPDELLKQLTAAVRETALSAAMTPPVGHAKHPDQPGRREPVRNCVARYRLS
jgi:hypothetical protein